MTLAEKLVHLRKKENLTQQKLAEKLNVSRQAVSRWELGEATPSVENMKILSDLYDVRLDYLLKDIDYSFEKEELLASGDNRHSGSGEKRQFWSTENSHLQFE